MRRTNWNEIKRQKGATGPSGPPRFTVTYEPDLIRRGRVATWLLCGEDLVTQAQSLPDGSIDLLDAEAKFRDRANLAGWTLDGIELDFEPASDWRTRD